MVQQGFSIVHCRRHREAANVERQQPEDNQEAEVQEENWPCGVAKRLRYNPHAYFSEIVWKAACSAIFFAAFLFLFLHMQSQAAKSLNGKGDGYSASVSLLQSSVLGCREVLSRVTSSTVILCIQCCTWWWFAYCSFDKVLGFEADPEEAGRYLFQLDAHVSQPTLWSLGGLWWLLDCVGYHTLVLHVIHNVFFFVYQGIFLRQVHYWQFVDRGIFWLEVTSAIILFFLEWSAYTLVIKCDMHVV